MTTASRVPLATLRQAHVLGHAQPTDGGPAGGVVHHQDAAQVQGRFMDMDDLGRPQVVRQVETGFHGDRSPQVG
jgi:hypothetical protein